MHERAKRGREKVMQTDSHEGGLWRSVEFQISFSHILFCVYFYNGFSVSRVCHFVFLNIVISFFSAVHFFVFFVFVFVYIFISIYLCIYFIWGYSPCLMKNLSFLYRNIHIQISS